MTRTDILEHRSQFQSRSNKCKELHPTESIDPVGLKLLDAELGKSGAGRPSVKLRTFDRLLKHYLKTSQFTAELINEFNIACRAVDRGHQHDQAIRLARRLPEPETRQPTENKHDRILQEILSI